jgi:hypothetical protein
MCCNGCTYTYVANICLQCFICFLDMCCKYVYLDVAYASHTGCKFLSRCCICVAMVFHVFFISVSDACFKRFICLQTYVAGVVTDVSKVDRVLHFLSFLVLPCLGVSSSPFAALHPSHIGKGARRGWRCRRECMLSPSVTQAGSALFHFFFVTHGCLDVMLSLVSLRLELGHCSVGWD